MQTRHIVAALLGLAACSVGPRVERFPPAQSPGGAVVRLDLGQRKGSVLGELIAVQDTALIVREESVIALVPLRSIRAGKATAPGSRASFGNGRLPQDTRNRLRLLSRYPGGVTPELLRQLLDAYQQAELRVLPP